MRRRPTAPRGRGRAEASRTGQRTLPAAAATGRRGDHPELLPTDCLPPAPSDSGDRRSGGRHDPLSQHAFPSGAAPGSPPDPGPLTGEAAGRSRQGTVGNGGPLHRAVLDRRRTGCLYFPFRAVPRSPRVLEDGLPAKIHRTLPGSDAPDFFIRYPGFLSEAPSPRHFSFPPISACPVRKAPPFSGPVRSRGAGSLWTRRIRFSGGSQVGWRGFSPENTSRPGLPSSTVVTM